MGVTRFIVPFGGGGYSNGHTRISENYSLSEAVDLGDLYAHTLTVEGDRNIVDYPSHIYTDSDKYQEYLSTYPNKHYINRVDVKFEDGSTLSDSEMAYNYPLVAKKREYKLNAFLSESGLEPSESNVTTLLEDSGDLFVFSNRGDNYMLSDIFNLIDDRGLDIDEESFYYNVGEYFILSTKPVNNFSLDLVPTLVY